MAEPLSRRNSTFLKARNKPMPHRLLRVVLRDLSCGLVRLLFRVRYEGLENIPEKGPAILIANHTSLLDMFAIHAKVGPWIRWVSKKELYRHALLSALLLRLGCIPVNRDKADLAAARGIMGALKQQQIVGMFPQGTRVKPDQVSRVRPRSGAVHFAIRTGSPLLPVAIDGRFRLFSRVRVVYGRPFHLDQADPGQTTENRIDRLTLDSMQRVYDLIGQKQVYRLTEPFGEDP